MRSLIPENDKFETKQKNNRTGKVIILELTLLSFIENNLFKNEINKFTCIPHENNDVINPLF